MGPVVSEAQYSKIQGLIEKGIAEGARLVTGGLGRPEGLNRGYYVRPTVFADVIPGMTIEREDGKRQVDEQMNSGAGGKNCTTNIGSTPSAKPEVGQRYGAGDKGSQVVVVRGPVINVCK